MLFMVINKSPFSCNWTENILIGIDAIISTPDSSFISAIMLKILCNFCKRANIKMTKFQDLENYILIYTKIFSNTV